MPTATDCWSYARECEYWARAVHDEQDRRIFWEMAQAWAALALKEQSAFRPEHPRADFGDQRPLAAASASRERSVEPAAGFRKLRVVAD